MEQKKLVILLADISGYTRFMLENQTSAVHGQLIITKLIESILAHVDIPLTLQEIEGDAVFLYAAHPGSDEGWHRVVEQVSRKLEQFFEAFIAEVAIATESTPCGCAVCRNITELGLKIIVHTGEAVFHQIAGRPQVSGTDVILAHRLLKNTVPSHEYLLLSEAAWTAMGEHLPGKFERHRETYEGFGAVDLHVRILHGDLLAARDAVYELSEAELKTSVGAYTRWLYPRDLLPAIFAQLRRPIRPFTWREKFRMVLDPLIEWPAVLLYHRRAIPKQLIARGKRRTSWRGRPDSAAERGGAPAD